MALTANTFKRTNTDTFQPVLGNKSSSLGTMQTAAPSANVMQRSGQIAGNRGSAQSGVTISPSLPTHIAVGMPPPTAPSLGAPQVAQPMSLGKVNPIQTYEGQYGDSSSVSGGTVPWTQQQNTQPQSATQQVATLLYQQGDIYTVRKFADWLGTVQGAENMNAGQLLQAYQQSKVQTVPTQPMAPAPSLSLPSGGFNIQQLIDLYNAQNIPNQAFGENLTRRSGQDITDMENLQLQMIAGQDGLTNVPIPDVPVESTEQAALRKAMLERAQAGLAPLTEQDIQTILAPYNSDIDRQMELQGRADDNDLIARGVLRSGESVLKNRERLEESERLRTGAATEVARYDLLQRQPQNLQLAAQIAETEDQLRQTPFNNTIERARLIGTLDTLRNAMQQQSIQNVSDLTGQLDTRRNNELNMQLNQDQRREDYAYLFGQNGYVDDVDSYIAEMTGGTGGLDDVLNNYIADSANPDLKGPVDPKSPWVEIVPKNGGTTTPTTPNKVWDNIKAWEQAHPEATVVFQSGLGKIAAIDELYDQHTRYSNSEQDPITTAQQHFTTGQKTTPELAKLGRLFEEEKLVGLYNQQSGAQMSGIDTAVGTVFDAGLPDQYTADINAIAAAQAQGRLWEGIYDGDYVSEMEAQGYTPDQIAQAISEMNWTMYENTMTSLKAIGEAVLMARYDRYNRTAQA